MSLGIFQATIVDEFGNVQAGAEIQVFDESTGLLAELFSDKLGTALDNPFFTSSDGFAEFYANSGEYRISAVKGLFSRTWRYVQIGGTAAQRDTGTDFEQVPLNTNIVYPVATVADLRLLEPTVDGQQFNLLEYNSGTGLGGGSCYYDASDTTSVDDGIEVFVTSSGARIKRVLSGIATPALAGGLDTDTNAAAAIQAAIDINEQATLDNVNYNATDVISFGNGDHLTGGMGQLTSKVTTSAGFEVSGAFASIANLTITTDTNDVWAVDLTNTQGYGDFGNHLNAVRASGLKGFNVDAYETKIEDCYLVGLGDDASGGIGIEIDQFDTSIDNTLIQDYEIGVQTYKGLQANDLHIVRADKALTVREQGEPSQFVNTYIDTPIANGIRYFDQQNCVMVNTQFLKIGSAATAATAAGIALDTNSKNNSFISTNFNQPDLTTVNSMITFESGSINNLFVGITGAYKLASGAQDRMRNQTITGATGGWARHNNISRKLRATATGVAAATTTTMVFQLEYEYPTITFNTLLFKGTYVSRNAASQSSMGDVYVSLQYSDYGSPSTVVKIAGHADNTWSIDSATLLGDELTVVFQNDGTNTASIAVELDKAIDATGSTF